MSSLFRFDSFISIFFDVFLPRKQGILSNRWGDEVMNEQELKGLIERSVAEFEHMKKVERIQYIMDFGKVYIQYDFCLN